MTKEQSKIVKDDALKMYFLIKRYRELEDENFNINAETSTEEINKTLIMLNFTRTKLDEWLKITNERFGLENYEEYHEYEKEWNEEVGR